ncbi:MAG: 50S ribosomal protein L18 [Patescibacteria group bacterium]
MRKEQQKKIVNKQQRQNRVRVSLKTNSGLPRLCVFRSLKHFYLQIIDDVSRKTLCSASDKEVVDKKQKPLVIAGLVGQILGKKAIEKGVEKVVFDRGSYQYHGRVKAAADGAREAGLKF